MASILLIRCDMDQDALIAIRKWYENQLEPLKGSPSHSIVRRYIYQRINEINMILFSQDEQETLRSLDALCLLCSTSDDASQITTYINKNYKTTDEETPDFIFDLCSRSKGAQEQATKARKENHQTQQ